jgi:hypothetical protein
MATSVNSLDSQTKTTPLLAFKGHVYTMMAAFAGVVLGVLGSMGFVSNMLQSQFAAQNAAMEKRLVAVAPASDMTACYGTSAASTTGDVGGKGAEVAAAEPHHEVGGKGADTSTPATGGKGADMPFVNQMINGSITNTGPDSHNTINASNTFNYSSTNNNNVNVSKNNNQSATSGSANTSSNTDAGSSQSGNADNHNSDTTWVNITN